MEIRKYRPADCVEILSLFYDTVHSVCAKDYTREQLDVWADGKPDAGEWNRSFSDHSTWVAVEGFTLVGFGDITDTGYLDRLYVHKDYQRQGIATLLCDKLEGWCLRKRIFTRASATARPFFEKRGYRVVGERQVERGGISLSNYEMEKRRHRYR